MYLRAEGIERQERLQYLRQTWNSSIWCEEDDESYRLLDPEIPLVYSLHYAVMGVVPLLIFFNEASINAFMDPALDFFNLFLRSGIGTTSHSRLLKFRFQF